MRRHQHCHLPYPSPSLVLPLTAAVARAGISGKQPVPMGTHLLSPHTHPSHTGVFCCWLLSTFPAQSDIHSYKQTKRGLSFGLIIHEKSSCFWGQCAHCETQGVRACFWGQSLLQRHGWERGKHFSQGAASQRSTGEWSHSPL